MTGQSLALTQRWRDRLTDYVTAIAWSPNGAWIAATSSKGEVILFDWTRSADQCRVTLRPAADEAMSSLGFSSDGQYLAAAGQSGDLVVWSLQPNSQQTYPVAFRQAHSGAWIDQLAWHPTQPCLAYGIGAEVKIWDAQVAQDSPIAELDFQNSSALHLAWHPNGQRLAISGHGGIKVWEAADWGADPKVIAVPGASLYAAWSDDGRYLASGNLDRTLTVVEWGNPPPWLMQGFPGKVRQVAWSNVVGQSGAPLLAAACVEGVTVWLRSDGSKRDWRSQVLQHHTDRVNAIAFRPQTSMLASAGEDGKVCFWEMKKTPTKVLKFPDGGCSCLAWHPSGDKIAIAGTAGAIGLWELESRAKGFG
ncbi:MAG: WD40 repeat domain-containing protein [Elainellaceae cyanobacterium]